MTGPVSVAGISAIPNSTYETPERDLAAHVLKEALQDADLNIQDVDGLYMPKPRPWTPQGFFSTFLAHQTGMDLERSLEVYTGGTSGGTALRSAVTDIRDGDVETAVVLAVERNSISSTDRYFEYILGIFDREFQSPMGPSIPSVYAQSLRRYCYEYDVDREAIASIVKKNRKNAQSNPDAVFYESEIPDIDEILESRLISDPLHLYECPRPTDGAAAIILTAKEVESTVRISGAGYHHPSSHLIGARDTSMATLPAAGEAVSEALTDATLSRSDIDVLEPYAPFPHIEAILLEEIGLTDRGTGADECVEGRTEISGELPVSPSGGCIGRGHPAMVTPLLNHVEAVRQLRGDAANQVPDTDTVLTTSEHGHVDGMNAHVFTRNGGNA